MKKALVGLLSIMLLLASFWGANTRNHRSKDRGNSDKTLWV